MSPPAFDTVVIGLGAMGSATLLQLAHGGQRVLGLDARRWAGGQFLQPPHLPSSEGVKVAMEQYSTSVADPGHLDRAVAPEEVAAMHCIHLTGRIPGLLPQVFRSAFRLYTMTPDGDFLIAPAPENDRVLLVSACSGHGFKHSAGLEEAVADMLAGGSASALAGFAATRLATP